MEQQGFGGGKIASQKCNFLHSCFLVFLVKNNNNNLGFEKRMTRDSKNIVLNQIKIVCWILMWFKMASQPGRVGLPVIQVICQTNQPKSAETLLKISQQMCLTSLGDQQTILHWSQLLCFRFSILFIIVILFSNVIFL